MRLSALANDAHPVPRRAALKLKTRVEPLATNLLRELDRDAAIEMAHYPC
jgi:hypothetical protein